MKICLAQTKPFRGDTAANIASHKKFIHAAAEERAELIVFPELSLSSYEPELAKSLATDVNDPRFDEFQALSDANEIIIGAGVPVRAGAGVSIGMLLFQPRTQRRVYLKQYLHADEEPFFTGIDNVIPTLRSHPEIALAICYEMSVPEHVESAAAHGAKIYIASVVKNAAGVEKGLQRLQEIANKYSMTAMMVNCVGETGDGLSAGQSSVVDPQGEIIVSLDAVSEGLIIYDTETNSAITKYIQ
ncbi:MAG: carbon-nitrogen hydrolase family protein [Gemmatimonadaceae bacterium]|nr:carbon-nitrogen hydrolase family protein [Chitinophagaceae bacterium]